KHADETLPFPRGTLAGTCKSSGNIRVKSLLTRLIELVHGAGLAETFGELRRRFGRGICLRKEANQFLCCDGAIKRPAGFGGNAQRFQGGNELRLPKAVSGDFAARR